MKKKQPPLLSVGLFRADLRDAALLEEKSSRSDTRRRRTRELFSLRIAAASSLREAQAVGRAPRMRRAARPRPALPKPRQPQTKPIRERSNASNASRTDCNGKKTHPHRPFVKPAKNFAHRFRFKRKNARPFGRAAKAEASVPICAQKATERARPFKTVNKNR